MSSDTPPTREERLAAKLRENLRRRKAQARALGAGAPAEGEPPALPPRLDDADPAGGGGLPKPFPTR